MSEDQATAVRDAYEALRRADIGGVLAHMSPDVQWHLQRRSLIGRGEVEELLTSIRRCPWPAADMVLDELSAEDGRVLVTGSCGERFAHAWTLRGEVLSELQVLPA